MAAAPSVSARSPTARPGAHRAGPVPAKRPWDGLQCAQCRARKPQKSIGQPERRELCLDMRIDTTAQVSPASVARRNSRTAASYGPRLQGGKQVGFGERCQSTPTRRPLPPHRSPHPTLAPAALMHDAVEAHDRPLGPAARCGTHRARSAAVRLPKHTERKVPSRSQETTCSAPTFIVSPRWREHSSVARGLACSAGLLCPCLLRGVSWIGAPVHPHLRGLVSGSTLPDNPSPSRWRSAVPSAWRDGPIALHWSPHPGHRCRRRASPARRGDAGGGLRPAGGATAGAARPARRPVPPDCL